MMKYNMTSLLSLVAVLSIVGALALTPASALQQPLPPDHPSLGDQLPPGHPPVNPGLPPGHPPLDGARPAIDAPAQGAKFAEADSDDVASIDAIVDAYYDSVSGKAGIERDWNRFRSLFIPEARLIAAQAAGPNQPCVVLSTEQFVRFNASYFEQGGYVERGVHRITQRFGNAAHVFSTYEARRAETDDKPYSRGINSMQLVHDGNRWWIVSVMWDYERDDNPIPAQYLSPETGAEEDESE